MTEPLVVDYLRTHSFAELFAAHGVRANVAPAAPYKASLNYDMIAARESDPLAAECRGLVLATLDGAPLPAEGPVGETRVIARPMDRFFNHGGGLAPAIDLADPTTRVFEKLDGTLCVVYHDPHAWRWCVATRAVAEADRPVDGFKDHTFRSLFAHALGEHLDLTFDELTKHLAVGATYCFELTSPRNRVVVDHAAHRVHLLAVRYASGAEVCPHEMPGARDLPIAPSHVIPTKSVESLLDFVLARPPTSAEGVVVRMGAGPFRRVKVKSAAYVATHGLLDAVGSSPRALLTTVLAGRYDDVAPLLKPHLRAKGDMIQMTYADMARAHDAMVDELLAKHGADRKGVAVEAQARKLWLAPVMARFAGKCDSLADYVTKAKRGGEWHDAFLDNMLEYLGEKP